jgi:hypothetical protein
MYRRAAIALTLLLLLGSQSAVAAPKVNTPCKVAKQRAGSLICTKVGGKLLWKLAPKPSPKPSPTATPLDMSPASTGTVTNNNGLIGRTLMGYQGWFACPTDDTGPDWVHWFDYGKRATASGLTVDFWPDVSEYSQGELCKTEMTTESGQPLMAYSGYNQTVINRHFSWLQQYNIDGVALQRFVARMIPADIYAHDWTLLQRVSSAAQRYGRVFYFEYDTNFGDDDPTKLVSTIKQDWKRTVDAGITSTSSYLQLNGQPLVELWGIGLPGVNRMTASQAADLVAFFKQNPDPKYRAAVVGGLGSYWRTGTGDAQPGEDWAKVYRSFDVINPWSVGRYGSINVGEAQTYANDVVAGDVEETQRLGILYLPVVWPGSSWINLQRNRGQAYERNMMPRFCGAFYWQQVVNVLRAGSKQVFVAMFDEVDEGTAMYKMVSTQADLPKDSLLIPLDVDGCKLNSDFYLRLASATAATTRSGTTPTRQLPIPLAPGETVAPPTFGRTIDGSTATSFERGLS